MVRRVILLLLLATNLYAGDNVVTSVSENSTNGFTKQDGVRRTWMASDGTMYVQFQMDSNGRQRYGYSTDMGATWSYSDSVTANYLYGELNSDLVTSWLIQDTLYVFNNRNDDTLTLFKAYRGSEYARLNIGEDIATYPAAQAINYTGIDANDFIIFGDSTGSLKPRFRTDGRIINGQTMTKGGTQNVGGGAALVPMPTRYGIAVFNAASTTPDLYFVLASNGSRTNNNMHPSILGTSPSFNTSLATPSAGDSLLYIASVKSDNAGIRVVRGNINSVGVWTFEDSVVIDYVAPLGDATPLIRRDISISVLGTDVYLFAKYWADTTDKDNIEISYWISTDSANSFGTRQTLRAATGTDSIYFMTTPPQFANGATDVIYAAWRQYSAGANNVIYVSTDTLGGVAPAIYRRSKILNLGG